MMRSGSKVVGAALALALVGGAVVSCGNDDAASSCPPVALAFLGALSGPEAANGETIRNSAAMAVEEHNLARPECEVGFISFDSQGDQRQATALASQIVGDPQIIGVVGPVFSGETRAVMPKFEEAGLPVLTPSATNPGLSGEGWRMFHRLVGTDAAQGPAIATWLTQVTGVDTVAVIDDGTLYGRTLADLLVEDLNRRGIAIVPRQQVEPGRRDYGEVVRLVKTYPDIDAVFFGGIGEAGVQLHRQLRDAGVAELFVGGDGVFLDSLIRSASTGDDGEGVLVTCPCIGVATTDAQKDFAERYVARYDSEPVYFGAEGFDAAGMLLAGIDSGATTRSELASWLDSATFNGVTKTVRFDGSGEVVGGPVFFFTVDDGVFVPRARILDGRLTELGR